jgi:hypothetical protein
MPLSYHFRMRIMYASLVVLMVGGGCTLVRFGLPTFAAFAIGMLLVAGNFFGSSYLLSRLLFTQHPKTWNLLALVFKYIILIGVVAVLLMRYQMAVVPFLAGVTAFVAVLIVMGLLVLQPERRVR